MKSEELYKNVNNKTLNKSSMSPTNFVKIKLLGEGAFGKVYCVKNKNSDQLYAMKKMRIDNIIENDYVRLIKNERVVMEKACEGHPFLVGLEFAF